MYVETLPSLQGKNLDAWKRFVQDAELEPDGLIDKTVLVWDNGEIAATGSRYNSILKLIAVSPSYRGEDLTATVISAYTVLRRTRR